MTPEPFKGQDRVLGAPKGWDEHEHGPCAGLPVCIEGADITSCWRPTWREVWRLLCGQRVWVTVVGGQPPMSIHVCPAQPVESD